MRRMALMANPHCGLFLTPIVGTATVAKQMEHVAYRCSVALRGKSEVCSIHHIPATNTPSEDSFYS